MKHTICSILPSIQTSNRLLYYYSKSLGKIKEEKDLGKIEIIPSLLHRENEGSSWPNGVSFHVVKGYVILCSINYRPFETHCQ